MIRIITDSAADLTAETASRLQVEILPIKVHFANEEYLDGVDLSHEKFYEMLAEAEQLPSTSQITPYDYEQCFRKVREAGDTAVIITLSSGLSGTYQSACLAAQDFEGTVFVVDSIQATVGQQVLVRYACQLRERGLDAGAIAAELEARRTDVCLVAAVDTLKYLQKGGRVSPTVALVGGLLSIKPVMCIRDGVIHLLGQARGAKNVHGKVNEMILKEGAIDYDYPCVVGYTGTDESVMLRYLQNSEKFYEGHAEQFEHSTIGCTIGTHVGPGAVIVAYIRKSS